MSMWLAADRWNRWKPYQADIIGRTISHAVLIRINWLHTMYGPIRSPFPKNNRIIEVAFFGGSFTGIDFDMQGLFLSTVHKYIKKRLIDGIRLSTRPDYVDKVILNQLKEYGVTTIELGVQSLNDDVLKATNRGHTVKDVYETLGCVNSFGFGFGRPEYTATVYFIRKGSKTVNVCSAIKIDPETRKRIILIKNFWKDE